MRNSSYYTTINVNNKDIDISVHFCGPQSVNMYVEYHRTEKRLASSWITAPTNDEIINAGLGFFKDNPEIPIYTWQGHDMIFHDQILPVYKRMVYLGIKAMIEDSRLTSRQWNAVITDIAEYYEVDVTDLLRPIAVAVPVAIPIVVVKDPFHQAV